MKMALSARALRPGHIVVLEDGKQLRIASARVGSTKIEGYNQTARAIDVTFEGGVVHHIHPASSAIVRVGFFQAIRLLFSD